MRGLKTILRIGWILLRGFLLYLYVLMMKTINIIAPDWTLRMIQKRMQEKDLKELQDTVKSTDDAQFFFSFDMPWNQTRKHLRDTLKEAQLGDISPNPSLVNLTDRSSAPLLSFAKTGRPLVLNFGSCT